MNSLTPLLVLALAALPDFQDGAPVLRASSTEASLAEAVAPTAESWARAKVYRIPLRTTPPHPRSEERPVQTIDTLEVRALAAADGVALRIVWRDETADLRGDLRPQLATFPDSVAVQFPAGASESVLPALAMGSPEKKVNIWRWIAGGGKAEESIADGIGRIQTVDGESPVGVRASRVEDGWAVTLWRPYEVEKQITYRGVDPGTSERAERVSISPGARLPCAFAVWNGAYENRGGLKAVSIWYYLQLPPPPDAQALQPPPTASAPLQH